MWRDGLKYLNDWIVYLPATSGPLSADVFFMETDRTIFIYDVGSCAAARERIEGIKKEKIVVLSHFHADHTDNLAKITFQELYAGKETIKHVGVGRQVLGETLLEPDIPIRLILLPSSHAKGCVALCCGKEYAFCGDGLYAAGKRFPEEKGGYTVKTVYNAQKLKEMIRMLKELDVKYFVLSHEEYPVRPKEEVIRSLELIYQAWGKDDPYIII
ncbi:MAG: MBL fold metallo-hydrolase [Lachnospiraceae bacterium]|nr:MBL fold metallo-hydrolase [Lachnospiraceae bacterium]